ncbi:MAG: hypothetical protein J7K21_02800 [Desulfurococcales archaeon]|nr:hypothetical protein [Desulfurococcales archaeon]
MPSSGETKEMEKLYYREALEEALRILEEDEKLVEEIRKIAEESPFKYYYLGYTKAPIKVEIRS